jgi:hypothetical protein
VKSCVSPREANALSAFLQRCAHYAISFLPRHSMSSSRRGRRRLARRFGSAISPLRDAADMEPTLPPASNHDSAVLPDLASRMAPHLEAVMERLLQLSKQAESETVRLAALREILDRTYGKPTAKAPVTENRDDSLADWSDEDLETVARRGAGGTPATGKRPL